jgi:hypothetical protein
MEFVMTGDFSAGESGVPGFVGYRVGEVWG